MGSAVDVCFPCEAVISNASACGHLKTQGVADDAFGLIRPYCQATAGHQDIRTSGEKYVALSRWIGGSQPAQPDVVARSRGLAYAGIRRDAIPQQSNEVLLPLI